MLATLVIFLREGVEASMIVAILLAYLNRIGKREHFRDVFLGVGAALLLATATGAVVYTTVRSYDGTRGQTIFVNEGVGRCQREGSPIEEIHPGDRVFFEPEENHWHGAAPGRFMVHIAMQQNDENGNPVTWGEHVTDEQYRAANR